ncbi:hypothetical protein KPH14_007410 [Odynerus spinipes]|uniref:Bursicon n=1 Tax=Odynerus spinipes TaxID=1348599 RepID=A0AAD9RA99_9HYME|nr:hypothetical protein KPH14_007410 [Odynerus spinipes]
MFLCHIVITTLVICTLSENAKAIVGVDECRATPVIHFLQYPGCIPRTIPSYACRGRCSSYLQVSGSKIWQMERSCMCCQESGEREASVSLFCPKAKSGERKFRKVITKAPLECMCRPCTSVEEYAVIPQEITGLTEESPFATSAHFRRSSGLQSLKLFITKYIIILYRKICFPTSDSFPRKSSKKDWSQGCRIRDRGSATVAHSAGAKTNRVKFCPKVVAPEE